jgi:hypothetical protein
VIGPRGSRKEKPAGLDPRLRTRHRADQRPAVAMMIATASDMSRTQQNSAIERDTTLFTL